MSFSTLWQLAKYSMKSVLERGSRSSKRRQPLRNQRKAGTRLLLEVLEDRSLLSVNWINPGSGDWNTPANWFDNVALTNHVPGAADDVIVNVSGATLTNSSGVANSLNNLTSNGADLQLNGSFQIAGDIQANNLTFSGGTVTVGGSMTAAGQVQLQGVWSNNFPIVSVVGTYQAAGTGMYYGHLTLNGPVTGLGAVNVNYNSELTLSPATPQTVTMDSLSLTNNDTLDGSDNIIISGLFNLAYSRLLSTGTTTAAGGIAVNSSAMANGTLVNLGVATENWTLYLNNAHIDNQGTWEFVADGHIIGGSSFTNEGQVVADPGTTSTGVNVRFVNTGTVAVHGGTFLLGNTNDPGTSSTSTDLVADAGASLELDGNFQVPGNIQANNLTFSGGTVTVGGSMTAAGQVQLQGVWSNNFPIVSVVGTYQAAGTGMYYGHLTLNGPVTGLGAVNVNYNSELTLSPATPQTVTMDSLSLTNNDTLDGSDNIIISGLFNLAYSRLLSTGTTTAAGGIAVNSSAMANGTLVNLGVATENWTLYLNNAHIDNQGTWEFVADGHIIGGSSFTNEGQVVADPGTTSTGVNVRFVNTGTVAVHGGTFLLGNTNDPGTSSTSTDLVADAGASLELDGNFQVPGNIQANNLTFSGGTVTVGGSMTAAGQVQLQGVWSNNFPIVSVVGTYQAAGTGMYYGHLTLNGPVTGLGAVNVNYNSELTLSPATPQTVTMDSLSLTNNDTLDGSDNIIISGLFNLAYSRLLSTGTTTAAGGIAVNSSAMANGTLVNLGVATENWTLYLNNAHIDNQGTWEFVADGHIIGGSSFTNEGQVVADAGTSSTGVNAPFVNTGTVTVHGGTLSFTGGGTDSGAYSGDPGTFLKLAGGTFTLTPTSTISAANLSLTPSTSDIQLGGPNPGTGYDQITVGTSATLSGSLQLQMVNGFSPYLNEQFTILHSLGTNPISGAFSNLAEGSSVIVGGSQFQITYQGGANHNDVVLTAIKITPTISWSNPADITYGKALSKTQLNASAQIVTQLNPNVPFKAGTFVYTPAVGTILDAGMQTLAVTFTPTDTTHYFTTSATVTLNVNQANQDLDWANPAAIVYGTLLSGTQLNATVAGVAGGSAPGALSYSPGLGTFLGVGSGQILTVTAAATANYKQAATTVHINVLKTDTTSSGVISSLNPSTYGQAITLSVMVTANNSGAGTPSGTVRFLDAGKTIGTGTLDITGQATMSIATLTAGTHSFTATYLGDSNDNTSVSTSASSQTVNQAATTTTLVSSIDPSDVTKAVTFTATVHFSSGAAIPSGTVTFMDGTTPLKTVNLVNGSASFKTTVLAVGSHPITAVYSGNINYQGSTSDVWAQTVNPVTDLAVTMSSSAGTVKAGKNLTYTIKVTNKGPSTATGVDLTDILPAGVIFMSTSASPGTYQVNGNTITFFIGTMASGDSVTIKIVVDPTTAGSITDTASVTGDQPDPNSANNTATVVTTVN